MSGAIDVRPRPGAARSGTVAGLVLVVLLMAIGAAALGTAASAATTSTTFTATADAFVSTAFPSQNFGTAADLRMSNPQRQSFVKFDVSGLTGTITGASLVLNGPTDSTLGFDVRSVADSSWGETTITFNTAPAMGAVAASSGAYTAGPVSIDVTPLVTGNGTITFGLTRSSTNLLTVSSRESGDATAPKLQVTTETATTSPPPSSTSPSPTVTAPAGTTTTLTTIGDAFVSTAFPDQNFGSSADLRMSNPQRSSYVKFDLSGITSTITHANLVLNGTTDSSLGFDVRSVTDSSWGETTITFNNAPAMGSIIASSGAYTAGPVSIDVTSFVSDHTLITFGLTRSSANLLVVSSRESGDATAPKLEVTAGDNSPTPPPPTTPPSPTPSVTTPAGGTDATFTDVADAFVSTAFPDQNFGSSADLRMSNPQRSSYLRFNVAGLSGTVSKALLLLNGTTDSSLGFDVHGVADTSWGESTITFNNAPAMGPITASSGAYTAGPVSIDVTSLVSGNGLVSFGLTRTSSNLLVVSSRESGDATAPKLVVTTDGGTPPPTGGDITPPSTPTGLGASRSVSTHQIVVFWNPSTDDTGVTGYTIYRDGAPYATAPGTATAYLDTGINIGETYTYQVDAFDAAGNHSGLSNRDTKTDSPCNLCVLDPSTDHSLKVREQSTLSIPYGRAWVDSSTREALDVEGGSHMTAGKTIRVVGGARITADSTISPAPTTGVPAVPDPFDTAAVPTTSGPSFGDVIAGSGQTKTVVPGTYHKLGSSGGVLTLNPGVYVITDQFVNGGSGKITGNGVILVFPGNATLNLTGKSVTNLVSPKRAGTGTSDHLIFFARSNTSDIHIDVTGSTFKGHIYAAGAKLVVQTLKVTDDAVVVRNIEVHGGGTICVCS